MPGENTQLIRRMYEEGYALRRIDLVWELVAEDFRFHMRPEWLAQPTYSAEEMPQIWGDLDETYTGYSLIPEDFNEVGEYVVVALNASAEMRDGGERIESTIYHVWLVQDGLVREAWTYGTRSEAFAAVGLSE